MSTYRTEAVVLRSRKYMEADSLLTLLTQKRGKIGAVAKGVRKPNSRLRGGVQVFSHNDMLLHKGKNLDIVTQSQCLEAFMPLQEDMKAMAAACYWSELLDSLVPEGEIDPELFKLALAGYHLLCLSAAEQVIRGLEAKLLSLLGYRPFLDKCVFCGGILPEYAPIWFSTRLGGVLCNACGQTKGVPNRYNFSHEVLNAWQQMLKMDLSKLGRLKITPQGQKILEQVMDNFLFVQLDYPLKSKPILKVMLQADKKQ